MQLQAIILIMLPVFTPLVGSSMAAILAQDNWPTWANDTIAWAVLLLFAGGDMWANSQLSGGWVVIVADGVQAVTLLSSGWLVKLSPWLIWLQWLQANLFNLVPLFEQSSKPAPVNANPVRVPTALVMPQGSSLVPPRASADQPPQA